MKRGLLSLFDLSPREVRRLLARAKVLKAAYKKGTHYRSLAGRTLAMIFEKSSTRTRVSFEVGMFQLGGQAIFLSPRDLQVGRGEPIKDTARALTRYCDGILMRCHSQGDLEEMAQYAEIPVINGLTDLLHPCQVLSDIFTIYEKKTSKDGRKKKITVAYVGDGNNIANSWIEGAALCGFDLVLACPKSYPPDKGILDRARRCATSRIDIVYDPKDAVRGADVVSTDVWVSMGQESQRKAKVRALVNYQVNRDLLSLARKDAVVMHCLPAHRGEEISEDVLEGPRSIVFDQAENRLHVQKAILEFFLK